LRAFSRWLPGLSGSSAPFLLDKIVRRPGRVRWGEGAVEVALAPGPLDVVVEMSGALQPLSGTAWLGPRRVTFTRLPHGATA
jgi:hypothetical protein